MLIRSRHARRRTASLVHTALCGALAAVLLAPAGAQAQSSGGGDSTTIRLIQLLIQKGILTQGQAASLLSQAQPGAGRPPVAGRHTPHAARAATIAASAPEAQAEAPVTPVPPGEVRVTYVPQFVRDQIAAEVRAQVLGQVQSQGWAQPHELPDWLHRITVYGDLRLRYEDDLQDRGNVDTATGLPYPFPDFNAINSGSPFDIGGAGLPPLVNVSENRDRYRIRARVGVRAQINDWISTDIRLATGSANNPGSENQTLGQPGEFSEYGIFIDRAYFKLTPMPGLRIYAGRTPDPYFISDLMFANDLNFDGVAIQYDQPLTDQLGLFFNGGAHPLLDGALSYPSTSLVKGANHDSYLLAAQAGARWHIGSNALATLAGGYFAYSNISGKESAPCELFTTSDGCSTDNTRPSFSQFGNTMFALRDIVTTSETLQTDPQYFGLASHFGLLDLHSKFDITTYNPIVVSLEGEFVKNLAYNRSFILARTPVNNVGSNGAFEGGDTAYMAKLMVGYPDTTELWQWNATVGYKFLDSDSVLDAFNDQDFHLGGTNAKGYLVNASLGIAHNTYLQARWFSAIQVSGPPNGNDVLQIDLNTKF